MEPSMSPAGRPGRLCALPWPRWPAALQSLWSETVAAAGWQPSTARLYRAAFGRLLGFAAARPRGTAAAGVPGREVITAYVETLEADRGCKATQREVERLFLVLRRLDTREDWTWLKRKDLQLRAAGRPKGTSVRRPSPRRGHVEVGHWPCIYRDRWEAAFRPPVDEFDPGGPWHEAWGAATRAQVENAVGRYFFEIKGAGLPARIDAEGLRCMVARMQARSLSLWTAWSTIHALEMAWPILEPDRSRAWLTKSANNLKKKARKHGCKRAHARIVDPGELALLADELIARARAGRRDDHEAALLFRTGLFLAFVAAIPVRIGCIARTRIGPHANGAHLDLETAELLYRATETKEKREDPRYVPEPLLALILEWIEAWRPRLLLDPACDRLWVGDRGEPVTPTTLSKTCAATVERELGRRVSPQVVRHCVATLIKERYADEAEIATAILNHGHGQTTQHYRQAARNIQAKRKAQKIRQSLHERLRRELRAEERGRVAQRSRPLEDILSNPRARTSEYWR